MGFVYLAALVFGFGALSLQFWLPGSGDHGHAGGDSGDHGHGGDDSGDHGHGEGVSGMVAVFLSLRFWTYGLLAFGIVGALLHYLGLAGPTLATLIAGAVGLASGLLAGFVFSWLQRAEASSGVDAADAVGRVAKVLVPCAPERLGKIRLEIAGTTLDLLATTSDPVLEQGAYVLVEELRGAVAHVSRAPQLIVPEEP